MNETPATLNVAPIGYLRAAWATRVEAPRQPAAATDAPGVIELLPGMNLEHAIEDLAGWERIWVIFWFDRNQGWRPKVLPPRTTSGRKGVLMRLSALCVIRSFATLRATACLCAFRRYV